MFKTLYKPIKELLNLLNHTTYYEQLCTPNSINFYI